MVVGAENRKGGAKAQTHLDDLLQAGKLESPMSSLSIDITLLQRDIPGSILVWVRCPFRGVFTVGMEGREVLREAGGQRLLTGVNLYSGRITIRVYEERRM
jgi:hypothetical protein